MANTTSFDSGKSLFLAKKLTPAWILTVTTDPKVTNGRLYWVNDNQVEWLEFTTVTPSGWQFILGWLTRDIDPDTVPMTSLSTGKTWLATQKFILVEMHDQIFNKTKPTPIEFATTAARDTALGANWVPTVNYVNVKVTATGLFYNYNLTTGQWETYAVWTPTPNATTTVTWSVEIATQTEVDNVTDTGWTWATVSVIPSTLDAKVFKQSSLVNWEHTWDVKMTAAAAAPTNWLICDWASLLRAWTYAALFAAIGTAFGSADWTHFNIPDFRGRSPLWAWTGTATGATAHTLGATPTSWAGWEETHTLSAAELPSHTHTLQRDNSWNQAGIWTIPSYGANNTAQWTTTTTVTTSSIGSGTAHNIMSPNTTINFIIRI